MSIRAYAAHLGVTVATVSNWDRRGELAQLRTDTQQLLDIDLRRASIEIQQRFAAILAEDGRGSSRQNLATHRALGPSASERASLFEIAPVQIEQLGVDDLHDLVRTVSLTYLHATPMDSYIQAGQLTEQIMNLAESGAYERRKRDAYLAAGYLNAILGWMAGDVDDRGSATAYNRSAWLCAEIADHPTLRAWVLSTMSKTAMWDGRYADAAGLAARGQQYRSTGSVRAMLACQEADALAEAGAAKDAQQVIEAVYAPDEAPTIDEVGGLLACGDVRRGNYVTSVLVRTGQATRAVEVAAELLAGIGSSRAANGTVAQIRVGAARGHASLGQIDLAAAVLQPVLEVPVGQRLATVVQRVSEFGDMIASAPRLRHRPAAVAISSAIRAYCADQLTHAPRTRAADTAGGHEHGERAQ
jgi:hypothetical protein